MEKKEGEGEREREKGGEGRGEREPLMTLVCVVADYTLKD